MSLLLTSPQIILAGIPDPPVGNLNLMFIIIFMINSCMNLRELYESQVPNISDFTANPKYKTLRHLPFFTDAYQATKEHYAKLNDQSVSFNALFDTELKIAYQSFSSSGGTLEGVNEAAPLQLDKHALTSHLAGKVKDLMDRDPAKVTGIAAELGFLIQQDPKTGKVMLVPKGYEPTDPIQPSLFVGDRKLEGRIEDTFATDTVDKHDKKPKKKPEPVKEEQQITAWLNKWPFTRSYTDQQLKDAGAKQINGGWRMPQSVYNRLAGLSEGDVIQGNFPGAPREIYQLHRSTQLPGNSKPTDLMIMQSPDLAVIQNKVKRLIQQDGIPADSLTIQTKSGKTVPIQ